MEAVTRFLLVGAGSALGGIARYAVSLAVAGRFSGCFPWATFLVNVLGSLAIGVLSGLIARQSGGGSAAEMIRAFAVVGVCGGFTTFSTFSNEAFRLIESSNWTMAALYVVGSALAGVLAVFIGYLLAR